MSPLEYLGKSLCGVREPGVPFILGFPADIMGKLHGRARLKRMAFGAEVWVRVMIMGMVIFYDVSKGGSERRGLPRLFQL